MGFSSHLLPGGVLGGSEAGILEDLELGPIYPERLRRPLGALSICFHASAEVAGPTDAFHCLSYSKITIKGVRGPTGWLISIKHKTENNKKTKSRPKRRLKKKSRGLRGQKEEGEKENGG